MTDSTLQATVDSNDRDVLAQKLSGRQQQAEFGKQAEPDRMLIAGSVTCFY